MVAAYSRINTAEWRFSVHKMERRRRARPMNVTHPGAAGNKLTAALAVLALALMAANDQADAAPYSREYGYGFSACNEDDCVIRFFHDIFFVDRAVWNRDRVVGHLHGQHGDGAAAAERWRP